ncbi:MAG: DUF2505 domain-containing protein [Pseudomonadales bacterium]
MPVSREFGQNIDTVFELLTDPQFLVDRCLALGELSAECEIFEDGDHILVELTREVTRDLPSFLARIFDPVQTMSMKETWSPDGDGWSGHWTVIIEGQPVSINADFSLKPAANGCIYTVSHKAKAKIPLIGGKLEKFIQGQSIEGAEAELSYLKEHLDQ